MRSTAAAVDVEIVYILHGQQPVDATDLHSQGSVAASNQLNIHLHIQHYIAASHRIAQAHYYQPISASADISIANESLDREKEPITRGHEGIIAKMPRSVIRPFISQLDPLPQVQTNDLYRTG